MSSESALSEKATPRESANTPYEAIIGMEVHAELLTNSKLFCGCSAEFGGEPNTRCCPVCLGLPGALPVINERAVEFVLKAALALNCQISRDTYFHRKNYFYPDLPKAYQVSQYGDSAIGIYGWIEIDGENGGSKKIGIRRVHLEEDTGKLIHATGTTSEVDYNRSSVPLMEIVTEHHPRPGFDQIKTAGEARDYITKLRAILTYLGVCDGKMEEGSLRCEPNISVRPVGSEDYGTKTEIKNLNSFRAVSRGVEYEVERQIDVLRNGGRIVQETRRWDEESATTASMRSKEMEQEYRYFPEPDLLPFHFDDEQIEQLRASLPEMPLARRQRFVDMGVSETDAETLIEDKAVSEFFDAAVSHAVDVRTVTNWVLGDFMKLLNQHGVPINQSKVTPGALAELIGLIEDKTISGKLAKGVFEEMFNSGKSPREIVEASGQTQISDTDFIREEIVRILSEPRNQPQLQKYLAGNDKVLGFFVGQTMQATSGRANPQIVNELLKEEMEKLR
ncbi:MAG: Asp-tRNA(Asn)/Glu-tRNA(Gln) amidotransferase subunit GatB [Armatimonadetes bacterium]|nr:Asp-tRNA(Asn)/Glu-tRNA(Gln) amidotransferase subunit GatB [Armatimonadota bacterium]